MAERSAWGELSITTREGRLYLRIPRSHSPTGRKKEIALNFADNLAGRTVAAQILAAAQLDLYTGRLDLTLDRYRPKQRRSLTIGELWNEYIAYKSPNLKQTTIHYYREGIGRTLINLPCSIEQGLKVRDHLLSKYPRDYVARILCHLESAVRWAIRSDLIDLAKNPYEGLGQDLKSRHRPPKPRAMSGTEKDLILEKFRSHRDYAHYYPFVCFLFLTGCRPSEAIGLRWQDISADRTAITFGGSIVRIGNKPLRMEGSKTNRIRSFPVNAALKSLLDSIYDPNSDAADLVFRSRRGKILNYINFCRRAWASIAGSILNWDSTPYNARDTFITEQIAAGIPPTVIAKWVDNSVRMIESRYFDITAVDFMPK
jgi:integrase